MEKPILIVEDDGIGFDPKMLAEEQESGEHLGLMAIRERAELLGGELSINSLPGMGTRITVRIPTITGGGGGSVLTCPGDRRPSPVHRRRTGRPEPRPEALRRWCALPRSQGRGPCASSRS